MGCDVELAPDSIEVQGPNRLRGVDVDMNAFSDTMMTLAAIAPFADGPTTIRNVAHTRLQETDRLSAVATELHRLGVTTHQTSSSIRIIPQMSTACGGTDLRRPQDGDGVCRNGASGVRGSGSRTPGA